MHERPILPDPPVPGPKGNLGFVLQRQGNIRSQKVRPVSVSQRSRGTAGTEAPTTRPGPTVLPAPLVHPRPITDRSECDDTSSVWATLTY